MYTSTIAKCISVWFSHSPFFCFLLDFFKNFKNNLLHWYLLHTHFPGLQVQEEQHAQAQDATQSSFCLLYPIAQQHKPQVLLSGMIGSPTFGVPNRWGDMSLVDHRNHWFSFLKWALNNRSLFSIEKVKRGNHKICMAIISHVGPVCSVDSSKVSIVSWSMVDSWRLLHVPHGTTVWV